MTDVRFRITAESEGLEREVEQAKRSLASLPPAARTAQAGLDGMGMSAAQTAMAMRQVPMQITDIVTSLASGQPAMMVFLQQGGQLKDMFGGIAPAAKALASSFAGMVNPITLAGAAAAAVGVAWYQATQEAEAFEKSLIMSGNAIGLTSDKLKTIAADVGQATGAYGASAAALAEMAGSSLIAARDLGQFTEAAVRLEEITGQKIGDTRKQFEELAKSPLDALLKLNEGTNFLTTALYDQVKALDEQGKKTEAAEVAQRGYATAMVGRADQVVESTNKLVRAWDAVASSAAAAWRTMVRQFDDKSLTDKLGEIDRQIAAIEGRDRNRPNRTGGLLGSLLGDDPRQLESLRAQREALLETQRLAERVAQTRAESSAKERQALEQRAEALKRERDEQKSSAREAEAAGRKRLKALEEEQRAREKLDEVIEKALDRDDELQAKEDAAGAAAALKMWEAEAAARTASAEAAVKQGVAFADAISAIQFETETLRMSNAEREFAIEMRKLEAAGVENGTEAWNAYAAALRTAIEDRAQVRAGIESAKEFEETWKRTSNQVGQAFAYAIMDGGDSAANYVKRLFGSLVLTPMVNAIAAPISQGITGFLGGGSGAGSALSLASSAANAWSGFSSLGGLLSSAGSYAAAVPGLTSMAAGSQAAMLASQTGVFGSAGLSATAAAGGSTLGASVAAAAPWAAAALLAYSLLAKGGETRAGGGYGYSAGGASFGTGGGLASIWSDEIGGALAAGQTRFLGGPSGGEIGAVRESVAATVAGINDLFDRLGSTERIGEFWGKLEQSTKGRGGVFAGGTLASGASFGESSWEAATSRTLTAEQAVQAFALDLKQSTIQALQAASDIPAAMRDILTGVDAEALTDEQANAVLATVEAFVQLQGAAELLAVPIDSLTAAMISAGGGVDQLAANVAGYYQNFYSEAERTADATAALSEQFAEVGMVMPATREQFRAIVESLDLTTAEGQSAYGVMMSLQGAFAAIVPAAEATAASLGAMTQAMASAVDQAAGWPTADDWVRYAEAVADPQVLAATLSRSFGEAWAALDLGDAFPPPTSLEQYKATIASLDIVARESLPWAEKLDGALNLAPEFARLVQALDGTAAGVEQTVNRLSQAMNTLGNLQSLYSQEEYKAMMAPLLAEQFATIITDGTAMPTTAAAMRTLVESITDPDVKASLAEFVGQWDDFYVSVEKVSTSAVRATKSVNTMASQMQSAMQSVADFVQQLYVGDLAIGSPEEQFNYARTLYEQTLAAAPMSPEAMSQLAGYASQYARLGQDRFGTSTAGYTELIEAMRAALQGLLRPTGGSTRTEDISRETLSEIRNGNRLARRQLDAAQRAASRPSYAY